MRNSLLGIHKTDRQGAAEKREGGVTFAYYFPADKERGKYMHKKAAKYQEINLSEFTLFLSVMQNPEAYENVLSIILNERHIELKDAKVERVVLNDRGKKAIRLDAWARDSGNRQISTEMQNDTASDDMPRRARFYQGLMDSPVLKSGKGTRYRELPATIIIFITQEDILDILEDYGSVGEELRQKIMGESDAELLRSWHRLAGRAKSVEEFEEQLNKQDRQ